jgi:hypothetical protein
VEQLGRAGEAGTTVVDGETLQVGVGQPKRLEGLAQLVPLISGIDVDPEETLRPERADDLLGQLDATVGGVCIEQADGEIAQWRELSRAAAAAALRATRYCSASIVRSWGGSTSHDSLRLVAGSNSIDIGPHRG